MKCITLRQPHASQVAAGIKIIENRTWTTNYRGPLLIHAGSGLDCDRSEYDLIVKTAAEFDKVELPTWAELCARRGHILAQVDIIDVFHEDNIPDTYRGRWDLHGPWCWVLGNVRRVEPIPAKGKLGFWEFGGTIKFDAPAFTDWPVVVS